MDVADRKYATEVVSYLLSSYPQQAPDPEIYGAQLIALCIGRPKILLQRMVNPMEGLIGQEKFLPTIARVKEWLEHTPCESLQDAPWRPKAISWREGPEPTEEERAGNVERLKAIAEVIRKTADAKRGPWKQYAITDEETLAALENLESSKLK